MTDQLTEAAAFIPSETSVNETNYLALDEPSSRPEGRLTRLNGIALVIGLQIGSGIFSVPSQVSQFVATPGNGLLVWLLGGGMVWTGAASFIELGLRIPQNGGIQEYLRAAYGDFMGFLFTWCWVFIAKPAANAAIATIFANYLAGAFITETAKPEWLLKSVAALCIAIVTFVNCLGTTSGAKAANLFLVLKLGALGSIVVLGGIVWLFGYGEGVPSSEGGWFGWTPEQDEVSTWIWIGNFATALFGALFCYGGWEAVGFVMGDMENPEADLPIVLHGAMATVISGFLLMNAALYVCLPMDVMRTSSTVAVEFAKRVLGSWGGLLFSVVVSVSAMGALNANVFALGKLVVVASQRQYFPSVLANLHCSSAKDEAEYLDRSLAIIPAIISRPVKQFAGSTRQLRWQNTVPVFALLMNGLLASLYVVTGSFNGLVTFIGLAEYSFFMLSVVGLIIIRHKEKGTVVPSAIKYSTWAGNPIIFSVVSGLLITRNVISEPLQGAAILFVAGLGFAVFYIKFGLRGSSRPLIV